MDDKKKIVLGSEDILTKGLGDIFLNISLRRTFNQIKKDKYDNNFDLLQQFRKERNASRDFRIYGTVNSSIINTDSINIFVYKDSQLTQLIGVIKTSPLVYNEKNVYSKKRGKYLLELNNYDANSVYFKILGDNLKYGDQVFEQKLVFYGVDGQFIEYGTDTVDIGLNIDDFSDIKNDFPFFYNKHWIKKDLDIVEEKPTKIQFSKELSTIQEGTSIDIEISIDKPSPFGNESVVLDAVLGTVIPSEFKLSISGSTVVFPITLDWSKGEQNKVLTFDAIQDNVYEMSETIKFDLYNFQFCNSGFTTSHYATIEEFIPKKKTIYNLGEIYKNRAQFTGRTVQIGSGSPLENYSSYSILRNGLHFGNLNEEFYPGDTYKLVVTNRGVDTVLPINPDFGINSQQMWPSGEDKTFNLDTNYNGSEKHKIRIIFPQGVPHNNGKIMINGVNIPLESDALSYSSVGNSIFDNSPQDYLPTVGIDKDWSAVGDGISAITIESKTTGLPVKISIVETSSSFGYPSPLSPDPLATPIIEEVNPFIERQQIGKKLTLYSNDVDNLFTFYDFRFIKSGYFGAFAPAKLQEASVLGENKYLVTELKNVCRNWDETINDTIYSTAATRYDGNIITELSGDTPNQFNFLHPVGRAYINGSVLLSANNLPNTRFNLTKFNSVEFRSFPIVVLPSTNNNLLNKSISQVVKLSIPSIGQNNEINRILYKDNAESFRSFDFRTGTTGPFTTIFKKNNEFKTSEDIRWNNYVIASGATNSSSVKLGEILDYGNSSISILPGPLFGLDSNGQPLDQSSSSETLFLKSKTPGVPFEVKNIVNSYVHTTANSGPFGTSIVAGQTIGPILVEEIVKNGVSGVDLNFAKNWMGGYVVDI